MRKAGYLAIVAMLFAAAALLYRSVLGGDAIAAALGWASVVLGIAVVVIVRPRLRPKPVDPHALDSYGHFGKYSRHAELVGAVLVVGSFVWLGIMVALGAMDHSSLFFVWVALFLVGTSLLFVPSIVRQAIALRWLRKHPPE